MTGKRTVELILATALLGYIPSAIAGEKVSYPAERVAAFVVDNLDATSLPPVFRAKKEKGKKTFAEYHYTTQKLDETKALLQPSTGEPALAISILEKTSSGIYACMATVAQDGGAPTAQSVVLMKRKESSALLKVHDSWREFASCPAIGAGESSLATSQY